MLHTENLTSARVTAVCDCLSPSISSLMHLSAGAGADATAAAAKNIDIMRTMLEDCLTRFMEYGVWIPFAKKF